MRYSELVHFEPIESVVQLRKADEADEARRLVKTFVISAGMADQLVDLVFPQLQFEKPADNKGLLVVGNYGTGKSHLMAMVSTLAERSDTVKLLTNNAVAEKATSIAGRFKVVRAEINTKMPLRNFFCGTLETSLSGMGIDYEFPSETKEKNPKDSFAEMMAAFHAKHPKFGLLVVVDELLDYLRSRKEQELILDLNFLRAIGEFCQGSRLRFIAGIQESLFDSPRFQFVAESLKRVKDRFEQVRIAREDVAFVVAERLLKKDARQQARIREHLLPFAPLYESMNERMDDFVRLFPVHPAYLETFERVYVAEKREVLKTISEAMQRLHKKDVPAGEPGLVAYDSYWETIKNNPSLKADPAIRRVVEKADVLEARIEQSFTRPPYKPMALRIIAGLAVHRLTTSDVYAKMGATADELRDDLCLFLPMAEKNAEFLKTTIETVLKEILKTVSGQFLSFNKENGQYFLDLEKDVDFDSLIEKKSEGLSDDQLDHYYFETLARVLECTDQTYRTGFRIWEHELEWRERKAGRSGYLFFGAPNERPNTAPPRDFYLYFMEPWDPAYFKDEAKADEVFFRLKTRPEAFERSLKLYAGAREQAASASGANKNVYEGKAAEHLRALTTWLATNLGSEVQVTHQGRMKSLADVVRGKVVSDPTRSSVREVVNMAGSVLLAQHFQDRSPDYPTFSVLVVRENRAQAAGDALRWIGGGSKTKQGTAVLDALELLDGDVLRPRKSRYGKAVLDLLSTKPNAQVLNRSELIHDEGGIEYWLPYRIEPEFLAVVLAALVHSGDVVLSLTGKKLDAGSIDWLLKAGADEIAQFKHLERPKDLPLGPLQDLFEFLGLPRGLVVNPANREEGIQKLQVEVARRVEMVVLAQQHLQTGLVFWGKPLLTPKEVEAWRKQLSDLKTFLESLQPFNTVGKLKSFPYDAKAIHACTGGLETVKAVRELEELVQQLGPVAGYLTAAEALLPSGHPWLDEIRNAQLDLLPKLTSPQYRSDVTFQRSTAQRLTELKGAFQDAYLVLHQKTRLGASEDKKKGGLVKDTRLVQLQKLSGVEMMPAHQLAEIQNTLLGLKTCFSLTKARLDAKPTCPDCGYRPVEEPMPGIGAAGSLAAIDERLDELVRSWTRTLLDNLSDPTVAANVDLVSDHGGKKAIQEFVRKKSLPSSIDPAFIKALQEVLSGLQKVVLKTADIQTALQKGGTPCTLAEARERFDEFLKEASRGKDPAKVRVVLE
jgi:hypothetical protein